MKKTIFIAAVLFLVLSAMVYANRPEVEQAITSYEAIVVEAETLAEKPLVTISDFSVLDEKAKAADATIQAVQSESEWLIQDAKRTAELRTRFNQAIATIMQKLLKY